MKTYKKSPLPSSLKSVPKGYVYLGKGREFKTLEEEFRGYALYEGEKFDGGLLCDNQSWSGNGPNTYYFAPADSEIARLNGIKPRTRKVAPKPVPAPAPALVPKITPLPPRLTFPNTLVYLGKGGEFKVPDGEFTGDCSACVPLSANGLCKVTGRFSNLYYFAPIGSAVAILNGHKPPEPKIKYVIAGKTPWYSTAYIKIDGERQTMVSKEGLEEPYPCTDTHQMVERGDWLYTDEKTALSRLNPKPVPAPVVPAAPPKKATIADLWDAFKAYTKQSGNGMHNIKLFDDESGSVRDGGDTQIFSFGILNGGFTGAIAWLKANTK